MRSIRVVLPALVSVVVLAACVGPGGVGGPTLNDAVLRKADVPGRFQRCAYSGAIADYVQRVKRLDAGAADEAEGTWAAARSMGAQAGDVTGYAANQEGCKEGIGRSAGPSMALLVLQAKDEQAAAAIYRHGVLSFTTPPAQPEEENLLVGAATALGQNAWTLSLNTPAPGISVACWQDRDFVALLIAVGVPTQQAHQAAVAVDQRIA